MNFSISRVNNLYDNSHLIYFGDNLLSYSLRYFLEEYLDHSVRWTHSILKYIYFFNAIFIVDVEYIHILTVNEKREFSEMCAFKFIYSKSLCP